MAWCSAKKKAQVQLHLNLTHTGIETNVTETRRSCTGYGMWYQLSGLIILMSETVSHGLYSTSKDCRNENWTSKLHSV